MWKLDGLSEYDVRRPMTRTGTNLLGLVKHVAWMEAEYLSSTFDRPWPVPDWLTDEDENEDNSDMWATAVQSRDDVVALLPLGLGARRRHHRLARPGALRARPVVARPQESR